MQAKQWVRHFTSLFPRKGRILLFFIVFCTQVVLSQGVPYSDFYNMLYPAQAVACGLTINDSIDERRHPLMISRAIQHWKLTGCVEPLDFEEKNNLLTHQIENWDDAWQPFRVVGNFDLKTLAEITGIDESAWADKNPQFTYRIVPVDSCWLFMPSHLETGMDSLLIEVRAQYNLNIKDTKSPDGFYTVIVRSGESLSLIARREGVTVDEIQAWNGLNDHMIHPGQELIIGAYSGQKKVTEAPANTPPSLTAHPATDGPIYIVKPGDSLWSIARQFPGVSAQNIAEHNGLDSEKIDVGQKLIIPKYE